MTLGEKVKKYRLLRGMTQQELGMKMGFSEQTAGSRIRKYESGMMSPKTELRQKLADALDVDLSAITDADIRTDEDIMQLFFQLEDSIGLTIEHTEEKTSLSLDNNSKENAKLLSYLYTWYVQKQSVAPEGSASREESLKRYEDWKAKFPKDIGSYWDKQRREIDTSYAGDIAELSKAGKRIQTYADCLRHVRKMAEAEIAFDVSVQLLQLGDSCLILSFHTEDLLRPKSDSQHKLFAEYLFELKTLQAAGIEVTSDLLTRESGTQISYRIRNSCMSGMQSIISEIQRFARNSNNVNDWERDTFEMKYEECLRAYSIAIGM